MTSGNEPSWMTKPARDEGEHDHERIQTILRRSKIGMHELAPLADAYSVGDHDKAVSILSDFHKRISENGLSWHDAKDHLANLSHVDNWLTGRITEVPSRGDKPQPNPHLPPETRPEFSSAARQGVAKWAGLGAHSFALNQVLRGGDAKVTSLFHSETPDMEGLQRFDRDLSAAFAETPINAGVVAHREVSWGDKAERDKFLSQFLPGQRVVLPGYQATLVHPEVDDRHPSYQAMLVYRPPRQPYVPRHKVVLKIRSNHGIDTGPYNPIGHEWEYLIDKDSHFHVHGIRQIGSTPVVDLEHLSGMKGHDRPDVVSGRRYADAIQGRYEYGIPQQAAPQQAVRIVFPGDYDQGRLDRLRASRT